MKKFELGSLALEITRKCNMEENIICTVKEFSIEKINEYNNKYFSEEKDCDN